jgi:hypothetical protein
MEPETTEQHKVSTRESKQQSFSEEPLPKPRSSVAAFTEVGSAAKDTAASKSDVSPAALESRQVVEEGSRLQPVKSPSADSPASGVDGESAEEKEQAPRIEARPPEHVVDEQAIVAGLDATVGSTPADADARESLAAPAKDENEVLRPEPRESTTVGAGTRNRDDATGPFRLQGTELSSPAVRRFLIAKSVANNKPVGDLSAVTLDGKGVAAVYAFSDVVGMKDEFLYYDWFRNGERVARVRVGVWGKRWRSHSSKVINRKMKGSWRVELRNHEDRLLASADFLFLGPNSAF